MKIGNITAYGLHAVLLFGSNTMKIGYNITAAHNRITGKMHIQSSRQWSSASRNHASLLPPRISDWRQSVRGCRGGWAARGRSCGPAGVSHYQFVKGVTCHEKNATARTGSGRVLCLWPVSGIGGSGNGHRSRFDFEMTIIPLESAQDRVTKHRRRQTMNDIYPPTKIRRFAPGSASIVTPPPPPPKIRRFASVAG